MRWWVQLTSISSQKYYFITLCWSWHLFHAQLTSVCSPHPAWASWSPSWAPWCPPPCHGTGTHPGPRLDLGQWTENRRYLIEQRLNKELLLIVPFCSLCPCPPSFWPPCCWEPSSLSTPARVAVGIYRGNKARELLWHINHHDNYPLTFPVLAGLPGSYR